MVWCHKKIKLRKKFEKDEMPFCGVVKDGAGLWAHRRLARIPRKIAGCQIFADGS
jgi:hypothetical protein